MMGDMICCDVAQRPTGGFAYGRTRPRGLSQQWRSHLTDLERCRQWVPPADIAETESHFVISLEAPGIDMESLSITYNDGLLDVKGEKHKQSEIGECCHRAERYAGGFERRFRVSGKVDEDNIEAKYEDGIIKIWIPKTGESKPRRIEVH